MHWGSLVFFLSVIFFIFAQHISQFAVIYPVIFPQNLVDAGDALPEKMIL
jgi:hypothetical protein